MNLGRRILLTAVIAAFSLAAGFAASAQNATVTLTLGDSSTGEPVGFATVSLKAEGAKEVSKYVLSDHEGKAKIEKVRPGKYTLKAELMGYKPHESEIEVPRDGLDLGLVKMELDQQVLDAAITTAVGNPIVIKKDTVEYNASSFKTSDNDVLEELLKKLPGIEVSEDGTVTANGETITKITIDGKTFFLDDPQLATKNIPAKIVDKVKVVKKKSEQAEFTGIDDGNEEYVIDLNVKQGMMNGMFGSAMAGGGHDIPSARSTMNDWRYQGAAMIGRFTDKTQLSLILNGNNTNNRGFNDLSGSMMQSMMGGGGGGMGRGQGGWGGGNGITTSWMGGLNGAWTLFDNKMDLSGNYVYNNTHRTVEENSLKETYLTDGSTLVYENDGYSNTFSDGHRIGFRLDHKFSDNTSILIQPQLEIGRGNFDQLSTFTTDNLSSAGVLSNTNTGFSSTIGNNHNITTRGFALFRQRLGLPGRTISLMTNWNFSNNNMVGYNQSDTYTFEDDQHTIINQRYDQNSRNRSVSSRLVYTEPLGGNFYLEGSYSFSWRKNTSYKNTYDGIVPDPFNKDSHIYNPSGETFNQIYSNSILNRSITHDAGLNLAYQEGKTRAQLGISIMPTKTHNVTIDGKTEKPYDNKDLNWAPRAMLFYDINDNTEIRLFYNGRSSQPSTNQLMAVMDNSNPLNLSFGNPDLHPYFNHNFRSEFNYSNKQTFFTFRGTLEGGMVQKPIVSALWYDNSGVQYSMPVNGDNSYNGNFRMFLNWPIAKSNFSISLNSNSSYRVSGSFVGSAFDMSGYYDTDGSVKYEEFVKAFSDIRNRTDFINNKTRSFSQMGRLRLTYRIDDLEVTASGRARVSKPWYTIENSNSNATWNNQVETTVNWTPGISGFGLKADFHYNWYRGYSTPMDDEYILNAEISQLVFRRQVTLALKCYDILGQAKNLSVTDASNYHQEVFNNTLGRYIIFSVTWRFGNFGKAGQQMRGRMGGGPGGFGGRGPGGPPPGR